MKILSELNDKQKEAVTSTEGPVLVIAGPGSGKTKCLTHRIAYLAQQGVKPENIVAVTFTNKAAQEMQVRVRTLLQLPLNYPQSQLPTIGTFHSVCLRILRQHIDKLGYKKDFAIYDSQDQLSLVKQVLKDLQISEEQFKPATVLNSISRAKDELIDVATFEERASEYFPQTIARIYAKQQESLKKASALDFDDIIMLTVVLFRKYPEILAAYQQCWQYVLVDEGHDTNLSQYTLTNLLAEKHQNLWIIADPDQSIYSWRGADYRNILNFEKDYPQVKVIVLEQNYRSTQNILAASHHIINKNTNRKKKKLRTDNEEGHPIQIVEAADEREEGDFIVQEMENLFSEGYSLKDYTVLYRTNAQSRAIEEACIKASFPYKIVGSVKFYDRKEIKDIIAYLKFIVNGDDLISLKRILNTPPRRLTRFVPQVSTQLASSQEPAVQKFFELIKELRALSQSVTLTRLIKEIILKIDYEKYILNGKEEGERRWENVQELFSVAANYDQKGNAVALQSFLEEVALLGGPDEVDSTNDLVNLMTIHCAKGLEFPVVFIVGCEEGVFPHSKSFLNSSQMEEERRLFYVGLTRAKKRVYLSFAQKRRLFGSIMVNPPSRFIADLPMELAEYNEVNP